MKTYRTQEEAMRAVVNGVLKIKDDVTFTFDIDMPEVSIIARNITACYINAYDINVCNIKAYNLHARNIDAYDINANNIKACNIHAYDINANSIEACDINYSAVCFAYKSLACRSIVGRRHNSKHFCLDSEIVIKETK